MCRERVDCKSANNRYDIVSMHTGEKGSRTHLDSQKTIPRTFDKTHISCASKLSLVVLGIQSAIFFQEYRQIRSRLPEAGLAQVEGGKRGRPIAGGLP